MAVQAALRHCRSPENHLAEEPGAPALNEHVVKAPALRTNRTGPPTENEAAITLQYAVARAFIGRNISFQRMKLLQRIRLELHLMRGLRLLFWCMCMFAVVVCELHLPFSSYSCLLAQATPRQWRDHPDLLMSFPPPSLQVSLGLLTFEQMHACLKSRAMCSLASCGPLTRPHSSGWIKTVLARFAVQRPFLII